MATRKKTSQQGKNNGNGRCNGRKKPAVWARWPRERLLDLRLCDLDLDLKKTPLRQRTERLQEELEERGLRVRPHFWFSDDWFTPHGGTGIAIPFYLAHPRLQRLERTMMGEVEGGTVDWCMKLLRHEAGHVVCHAFQLNLRKRWQELFGLSSHRYPRFYQPNPNSKRYVQHLQYWYAQSHPDEDFAESFAVWLKPRSDWRRRYRGWPALRKLEYVDELMGELDGATPRIKTRAQVDRLSTLRKTIREHYERRMGGYGEEYPGFYDQDLQRLFTTRRRRGGRAASALIREVQTQVIRKVSPWIGENRYVIDHVMKEMVGRARELKLYTRVSDRRVKDHLSILLTKHVMNALFRHRRWLEL